MARDLIIFRQRRTFVDWDKIYPNLRYLDATGEKMNVSHETNKKKERNTLIAAGAIILGYYLFIYLPFYSKK